MVIVDPNQFTNTKDRIASLCHIKSLGMGMKKGQVTNVGSSLSREHERDLERTLKVNNDMFPWTTTNTLSIQPNMMSYNMTLFREVWSMTQKIRRLWGEKRRVVDVKVKKLQEACFIREITYTM